jgi:OFA family oxalate/formate antiporter-like MFS transporter
LTAEAFALDNARGAARADGRVMSRWLPILGGISLNLALGSLYAWSVFVLPLEKEFGWTRAQTSWVYTIAIVCFAATFIVAGKLQDAKGPRICAFLGALLVGGGFALSSLTTSVAFLYVAFGVIVGMGNGFGYAAPTPVASKWFPDRRGLAVGLMVGGYGAGSAIIGPVASRLITAYGWRATFQILGATFFVMGLIGTALLRNPPEPLKSAAPTTAGSRSLRIDVRTRDLVRTPTFFALWFAYCLGTTAGQMMISQLVPFMRSVGLSAEAAAFAITVAAFGNAGGRILSGALSDSLGRVRTLKVMVLGSLAVMATLGFGVSQVFALYLLVAAGYWCYGTQLSVFASTTADFYGTRYLGMNYGALFTAWGVAGIVGPFLAARTYQASGSYSTAFYSAAGLAMIAAVSLSFARPSFAQPAQNEYFRPI